LWLQLERSGTAQPQTSLLHCPNPALLVPQGHPARPSAELCSTGFVIGYSLWQALLDWPSQRAH
jgi:hypothetical protein